MEKKRHELVLEAMKAAKDIHLAAFRKMIETCTAVKTDPCSDCTREGIKTCMHETCTICLENIDLDDDNAHPICFVGGCCHTFHYICLGTWTNHALTCPRCRNQLDNVFKYIDGKFSTCVIAKTNNNRTFTNYDVEQYVHESEDDMDEDDSFDSFIDDEDITEDDMEAVREVMMAAEAVQRNALAIIPVQGREPPPRPDRAAFAWIGTDSWNPGARESSRDAPSSVLDAAPSIPLFLQKKMHK